MQPVGDSRCEHAAPEDVIEVDLECFSTTGFELPEAPSSQITDCYKSEQQPSVSDQLSRTPTSSARLSPASASTAVTSERWPFPRRVKYAREPTNLSCGDDEGLKPRSCSEHVRIPQRAARSIRQDFGCRSSTCEALGHEGISHKTDGDWFIYSDGGKYSGEWMGATRHGQGVQVWPSGMSYNGQWSRDAAEGQGRFSHRCGDAYEGAFQNNAAHGFGAFRHGDGSSYIGSWVDDEKHGIGEETWVDGTSYCGQYREGMKSGEGRFVWSDGSTYEGQFLSDEVHGEGAYVFASGMRYQGQWAMKKMHGRGAFVWDDGRTYVGDYTDNLKHGHGIFKWPDGRIYEGQWAFGSQHGNGRFTRSSGHGGPGEIIEGVWAEGRRVETARPAVCGLEQRGQMTAPMPASPARTRHRSRSKEGALPVRRGVH